MGALIMNEIYKQIISIIVSGAICGLCTAIISVTVIRNDLAYMKDDIKENKYGLIEQGKQIVQNTGDIIWLKAKASNK